MEGSPTERLLGQTTDAGEWSSSEWQRPYRTGVHTLSKHTRVERLPTTAVQEHGSWASFLSL